jgi:hypothetical protein
LVIEIIVGVLVSGGTLSIATIVNALVTVRLAKIEYWIEEMGRWKLKPDTHTFFPSK